MRTGVSATTTVTQTVSLKPQVKVKLRKSLKEIARIDALIAALEAEKAPFEAFAEDVRAEANVKTLEFEGFKVTRVGGDTSFFDKEQFVLRGGDLDLYNDCIEKKPKKEHTRVSVPKPAKAEQPAEE